MCRVQLHAVNSEADNSIVFLYPYPNFWKYPLLSVALHSAIDFSVWLTLLLVMLILGETLT